MKPTASLVALAALSLSFFTACANPSHKADAEKLRTELAGMPSVSGATLDYTEPITLDSGKLALRVTMAEDADADAVTDVVATTYDAFADAHHGEEGDLDVIVGDDVIHLRSFEPDADVKAVAEATSRAVEVLASGTVRVDINTQDVDKAPHVFTTYDVSVKEPGRDVMLQAMASMERKHGDIPHASWRVQSGGEYGWLLSSEKGFPNAEVRDLFDALSKDLPEGATILLFDDLATVQLPETTTPAEASRVAGRHLRLLGGVKEAFYNVESGVNFFALIADGECTFDTGAVGVKLEQDLKAECTKVSHPES